jgi:hypothetical protein
MAQASPDREAFLWVQFTMTMQRPFVHGTPSQHSLLLVQSWPYWVQVPGPSGGADPS